MSLLDEKKEFARMKSVINHDVRAFFEGERQKYYQICQLAKLPYVYGFSKRLRTVLMRH
jgi:hypothetical protein